MSQADHKVFTFVGLLPNIGNFSKFVQAVSHCKLRGLFANFQEQTTKGKFQFDLVYSNAARREKKNWPKANFFFRGGRSWFSGKKC